MAQTARERLQTASGSYPGVVADHAFGIRFVDKQAGLQKQKAWVVDDLHGVVDQSGSYHHDAERGICSHVLAQATGARQFIMEKVVDGIVVQSNFDDFNVWVQRPNGFARPCEIAAMEEAALNPDINKRVKKLGRNVNMSFMNRTETFLAVPSSTRPNDRLRGLEIIAPAVGLAAGNWKTLHTAWSSWCLFNGSRQPGRKVDPAGCFAEALRSVEEWLLWFAKDSLSANLCMEGLVQYTAILSQNDDSPFSFPSLDTIARPTNSC